jgi:hypothetical protein
MEITPDETRTPLRKILLDFYTRHKEVAELRPEWELEPLEALRIQLLMVQKVMSAGGVLAIWMSEE